LILYPKERFHTEGDTMKRPALFVLYMLVATTLSSDEHEWRLEREEHFAVLRGNYEAIKFQKTKYRDSSIRFLRRNRETAEADINAAFDYYHATPKELGFTKEEYLKELDALIESTNI
jgi:spore coat polysaccharide biosynthesis protein SpsF (cytidylyltransferase family)